MPTSWCSGTPDANEFCVIGHAWLEWGPFTISAVQLLVPARLDDPRRDVTELQLAWRSCDVPPLIAPRRVGVASPHRCTCALGQGRGSRRPGPSAALSGRQAIAARPSSTGAGEGHVTATIILGRSHPTPSHAVSTKSSPGARRSGWRGVTGASIGVGSRGICTSVREPGCTWSVATAEARPTRHTCVTARCAGVFLGVVRRSVLHVVGAGERGCLHVLVLLQPGPQHRANECCCTCQRADAPLHRQRGRVTERVPQEIWRQYHELTSRFVIRRPA
jgi:hypothetical protein